MQFFGFDYGANIAVCVVLMLLLQLQLYVMLPGLLLWLMTLRESSRKTRVVVAASERSGSRSTKIGSNRFGGRSTLPRLRTCTRRA